MKLPPLLKKHAKWFIDRIPRHRIDSSSAHSSFFLMISFLPFIALLLTLMQRIDFKDGVTMLEAAIGLFPESVSGFVKDLFPKAINSSGLLPIAIITLAWTSSKSMVAVIKGLDHIYEAEGPRNYIALRLVALFYIILFAIIIIITAVLLVFGSTIYNYLLAHSTPMIAKILMKIKELAGFVLLDVFFTLMFTFLPKRRVRFIHNFLGASFGAAGWVLFSYFFSLFVKNFSNFSVYGGLATLVILMYWLFFCMYIMFIGAEVSMWLECSGIGEDLKQRRAARKTEKTEKTK